MYNGINVLVPEKFHERIKGAVTQDRALGVKIKLYGEPNASIWVTPGQLLKIQKGVIAGKKSLTIRMSLKQVKQCAELLSSWKWRDSFEPGAMKKLRELDKSLEHFFTLNSYEMDSSVK